MISKPYRIIRGFVLIILFIFLFLACYRTIDADFGFHLQSGKTIIEHGIPSLDPFSYTVSDQVWINHEWLYDVLLAFFYEQGGYILLSLIFASLWLIGVLLALRTYDAFITTIAVVSLLSFVGVRTSAISLVFFVVLERMLERNHTFYSIPLLFILWANVHGSFPLGFAVIIFHMIIKKNFSLWKTLFVSIIVTCINPFGYAIYLEIFRTVFDTSIHNHITEWNSFSFPFYFVFALFPFIVLLFFTMKKNTLSNLILPLCLFVLGLFHVRYFLFFVASTIRYSEYSCEYFYKHPFIQKNPLGFLYTYSLTIITILVITIPFRLSAQIKYPNSAINQLYTRPCSGNIFNHYNYGGYLIWQLPQYKVFIDGRMPSWKIGTENSLDLYSRVITSTTTRRIVFETYAITCVLFPDYERDFITSLKRDGWIELIHADGAFLMKKP